METLKILVIDDEYGMRHGIERVLKDFTVTVPHTDEAVSFSLDQAETGEEGLEKMEKEAPDILLLDNRLPGISGIEILGLLAERKSDILTIMITAYASIETAIKVTKTGAYDFLAKPFTPDELKNSIRKATEHLLVTRQARRLAMERQQVRFQFISVLAHELKAPLNAVESYLTIIKNRSAGDDEAAYERMISRCLSRIGYMRKMITDLLDLTRIESGQKQRELGMVHVFDIAKNAIDTNAPLAAEMSVRIRLEGDQNVVFRADEEEIEIVLNNLISNAVKYNKRGGEVVVRIETGEGCLSLSVSDTGIGMSEAEASRLFSDFVRIKNEKTRGILGSGLGLSIVKKIVQLYDGTVTVKSEPDVGSTFTVVLHEPPA